MSSLYCKPVDLSAPVGSQKLNFTARTWTNKDLFTVTSSSSCPPWGARNVNRVNGLGESSSQGGRLHALPLSSRIASCLPLSRVCRCQRWSRVKASWGPLGNSSQLRGPSDACPLFLLPGFGPHSHPTPQRRARFALLL